MIKVASSVFFLTLLASSLPALAQQTGPINGDFKRQTILGKWSKDRFADVVVVSGPQKTIYLSGMGAEDAEDGHIRFPGDVYKQCQYAYQKIQSALAQQGASFGDIVKTTVYVTDTRYVADYLKCKNEALNGAPLGAQTIVQIGHLAHPYMLLEVDVTAVTAPD